MKIKKMDEALPVPNKWADEKETELFYKDYVTLVKSAKEHRISSIEKWTKDNITVLSNQGKALIAIRDITTNVIEGYSEKSVLYEMREPKHVYSFLDVDCVW